MLKIHDQNLLKCVYMSISKYKIETLSDSKINLEAILFMLWKRSISKKQRTWEEINEKKNISLI